MKTTEFLNKLSNWYPKILLTGGLIGFLCSIIPAIERIDMLKHPGRALICNLNPVVDCGGVLGNRWSSLFGFPNTFIGMSMFAILVTAGAALLLGGEALKRKFWLGIQAVALIMILFAWWFFGMSLFVIGKICLFCTGIWLVTTPLFWYGLLWCVAKGHIKGKSADKLLNFGAKHHLDVVIGVYVVMILLFLFRFRDYYFG